MKYRTLIVDDEPISRRRLKRFVNAIEDLELVAEAGDGPAAIAAVQQHQPVLMFLDIQMPGLDGFAVLRELEGPARPVVIFVTAFDQFAVRAFEAEALDYLLKPFGEERFRQAVNRARIFLEGSGGDFQKRVMSLLQNVSSFRKESEPLLVKTDRRIVFLKPSEIRWIEAEGDYMKVHATGETHFLRATMTQMEERLGSSGFLRIHRSRLVNLDQVKELRPLTAGESIVVLKSGERLTGSRKHLRSLQERFEGLSR
jgi:two-component system, LytTR family, response regulator